MAIAVKNASEATSVPDAKSRVLVASVIGAVYVACCLAIIIFAVPWLWKTGMTPWITAHLGSFFDVAGLLVVLVTAAAGLVIAGLALAGPNPPDGLRAGVFTFVAGTLGLFLLTVWVGHLLEHYIFKAEGAATAGLIVTILLGVTAVVLAVRYCLKPAFANYLSTFESQGWFQAKSFKVSQGRRVRQLTILGILLLIGTGIATLISHDMLLGNWVVRLPFTRTEVTLLPDLRFTAPLLLGACGLWIAWRAVNYPTFADFLIATEAEMNKVSWTTRKRLVQDTIVVLVTVILFTVFLLAIDQIWGWTMTTIGVVPKPAAKTGQLDAGKEIPW